MPFNWRSCIEQLHVVVSELLLMVPLFVPEFGIGKELLLRSLFV